MSNTKLIRSAEDGLLYAAASSYMDDASVLKHSAKYFAADLLYEYFGKDVVDRQIKSLVSGAEFQAGAILLSDSIFSSLVNYFLGRFSGMPEGYERILTRAALAQVGRGAANAIMPVGSIIPKVDISDV